MAEQIQADYDQLQDVATRFASQAEAIEDMQKKIQGSYEKLADGGWIGEGSQAFSSEMEDLVVPVSDRLKQALQDAGQAATTIAQAVKQAEEEASALFKSL
jgi:WXG100 family type VII secretion target